MPLREPTPAELRTIAADWGFELSDELLSELTRSVNDVLKSYSAVDALVAPTLPVRYPRTPGYRPDRDEDPHSAWYWKCEVVGADAGPLNGKRVALKDMVSLAGVPMMHGSRLLEGFVPDQDATVVTRILDAGGTIVGKTVAENLSTSGESFTADTGPVRNPYDPKRSAGGSSSGSGVVVAIGEADMAIGADQGGSIRIPSARNGITGLKPSYGLVPYTGCLPLELTVDHVGPMARTAADVALLLNVIAGPDGLDPRQTANLAPTDYVAALGKPVNGLRVGVVKEGFGWPSLSESDVDEVVEGQAQSLGQLGAALERTSIPWHRNGTFIMKPIIIEGTAAMLLRGNGMGTNWNGHYLVSVVEAFGAALKSRPNDLPLGAKIMALGGDFALRAWHGRFYAKAQNLVRTLRAAYDEAFETFDVLAMPTLPTKPIPLPISGEPADELFDKALALDVNTCVFNLTGHPAVTVPCGLVDGLPVAMMFVGRYGNDATLLNLADAYQRELFAPPTPPTAHSTDGT